MSSPVVVRQLVKRYGPVEALRGVSFEVARGEIFGLLGPNGAGKTSALECVIGLRRPDGGSISLCGTDALAHPERVKQFIGAQLQSTALQDKITPREALRLFGSFYHQRVPAETLIERFALTEKADAPFDTLSGGQRQRLALALAFVNEPQVLFLDEPTTGLDPQSRRELHQSILKMREDGHTVVLSTHYIEEAHQLCDRIAIIDHGEVISTGVPDELVARSRLLPRLTFETAPPLEGGRVSALPGVRDARREGEAWRLRTSSVSQTVSGLVKVLEAEGKELVDLSVRKPSLEDVFLELTGTNLRD